jgi:hypothetical protein
MTPHEVLHSRGQLIDPLLHLRKPHVHVSSEIAKLDVDNAKPQLYNPKTRFRLSKSGPNKSFKGREPLINGWRLSSGIPHGHIAPLSCPNVIRKSK